MDNLYLIPGLVMIIVGFGAKLYPKGIDSYQWTPDKDKDKIDLKRVANLYRNTFVAQGLITVVFSLFECKYVAWIFFSTIFIALFTVKIMEQKYFKGKNK